VASVLLENRKFMWHEWDRGRRAAMEELALKVMTRSPDFSKGLLGMNLPSQDLSSMSELFLSTLCINSICKGKSPIHSFNKYFHTDYMPVSVIGPGEFVAVVVIK
jgi:hypothetical protein